MLKTLHFFYDKNSLKSLIKKQEGNGWFYDYVASSIYAVKAGKDLGLKVRKVDMDINPFGRSLSNTNIVTLGDAMSRVDKDLANFFMKQSFNK